MPLFRTRSTGCTTSALVLALAAATALFAADAARAQLPAPPATTQDALHAMAAQAGVIFTGQVTAVRRIAAAGGSSGVVQIDFAVDDAILGVASGSTYTLREWAGLAPAGDLPYQPGRRYLMLLYAPGPSGLSSPVGGPDGAIPIYGSGPAAAPDTSDLIAANSPSATSPTGARSPARSALRMASPAPAGVPIATPIDNTTIDLRWIAARVLQPLDYQPDSPTPGTALPISAPPLADQPNAILATPAAPHFVKIFAPSQTVNLASPSNFDSSSTSAIATPSPGSLDLAVANDSSSAVAFDSAPTDQTAPATAAQPLTQQAAYSDVLALLRGWEQDNHAAR